MTGRTIAVVEEARSTLDQIACITSKVGRLVAAREQAESQLCHRLAVAWRSGHVTSEQLLDVHRRLSAESGPGYSKRWNDHGLPHPRRLTRDVASRPNGPHGSFHGPSRPSDHDPAPASGVPVVYVLFRDNAPVYLGSTSHLRNRLSGHRKARKFDCWTAWPCQSREEAYRLEALLLREAKPPANVAVPRIVGLHDELPHATRNQTGARA